MSVGDQDEVDRRKLVQMQSGMANAFDDFQPLRPVGVDQEAASIQLDEKGGVADPGYANLILLELGKNGGIPLTGALGEKGWDQDLGEKIPSMPPGTRLQAHFSGNSWRGNLLGGLRGFFNLRLSLTQWRKQVGHEG